MPLLLGGALLMFLPALGALAAAVYQGREVRAEIVQLSGQRAPWIDPGGDMVALLAASIMLVGAIWRAHRAAPAAAWYQAYDVPTLGRPRRPSRAAGGGAGV